MKLAAFRIRRSLAWAVVGLLWPLFSTFAEPGPDPAGVQPVTLETLRSRADAGDPRAQVELGLHLIDGDLGPRNLAQASTWLRKAAMQADPQGALELGVMYVNGEGVPIDLREGYVWYLLAHQEGNPAAKQYLDDLNGSLSPSDREKAQARAAELGRIIEANAASKLKHAHHREAPLLAEKNAASQNPAMDVSKTDGLIKPTTQVTPSGKSFVEGRDYSVWQRVRIKDQNGFAQPVEAYSILLPKGWRTEGQVTWVVNAACPADAVQNRLTATSPEGAFRLEVFPQRNWQWYDDPMLLQNAVRNSQTGAGGCPIARPFSAGQYLEQVFVPVDLRGAILESHRPNEEMARIMLQQARQNNALYQASGVNLESRPSAEIGKLKWPAGQIGIVLCAVEQTVSTMPNLLNGGTYNSYQCRATVKTMLSAPAGREEEAERILGTIVASTRINPDWQAAVQKVFNNIAQVELRETAKRAAIWRQTQAEIGDIQRRTWEDSQASRDRIYEGWSQTLRGVESWTEPGGNKIELSAGYNEGWSKGDGTYILSNDPLFDPNVVLQENWQRMAKKQ